MIKIYKFIIIFLLFPISSNAQDGSLDLSFGYNGKVVGDFEEPNRFESVALQPDGKFVSVGSRGMELMVARFLSDGSLDTSFGTNGYFFDDMGTFAKSYKVLIQEDGKILVFGTVYVANYRVVLLAARLISDGSGYDISFGTEGIYTGQIPNSSVLQQYDILDAIFLSDGKIGIAGRVYFSQSDRDMVILGRLTGDGQNDPEFGDNGITLIDFGSFSRANALVEAENGDLVITGNTYIGENRSVFIARFNESGNPVTGFGTNGFTFFNESDNISNLANDMVVLPSGQFLVGGKAYDSINNIVLYLFNPDGSMNTNIWSDGFLKIDLGNNGVNGVINSLILQSDGYVLAGGSNSKFMITRFTDQLIQDINFGNMGWSINDIGSGNHFDEITDMKQLNNGDIIAVGVTLSDGALNYAVAKFTSTLSTLDDLRKLGIEVRVFPNITQEEELTLELTTEAPLELNISLLNSLGQRIKGWKNTTSFSSGTTQETLELPSNLTKGGYFILVETSEGRTALPIRII